MPPWLREQLPLVYDGDSLAAVADLWICEGFQAEHPEPAFMLLWTRNPSAFD